MSGFTMQDLGAIPPPDHALGPDSSTAFALGQDGSMRLQPPDGSRVAQWARALSLGAAAEASEPMPSAPFKGPTEERVVDEVGKVAQPVTTKELPARAPAGSLPQPAEEPLPAQPGNRSVSLAELREQRDRRMPAREEGAEPGGAPLAAGGWTRPLEPAANVVDGPLPVAGQRTELHAVIQRSCDRLWVDASTPGAPQGVMLDLGRWMPGCTVELAKASGQLRITLRGVDADRRVELNDALEGLGEDLAARLGCPVITAVSGRERTR
jgi:hypothetical protein